MNTVENNNSFERDVGEGPTTAINDVSTGAILSNVLDAGVPLAPSIADAIEDKHRADEVIIKGSLWAAIWHMSWPLFLNMITIAVASFADLYVAGRLGSAAQAAVGLCGQIWFFMVLLAVALSAGTNALVSRFFGEGDLEKTTQAARQSLLFACLFGTASAVVGLLLCRPLLQVLGASPAVEKLGWDFLKFDLLAQLPFTIIWVSNSIFRAKGNARIPMMIMALIVVQVILLDFGLCIWPLHVGISGIGMSWGIASILGVGLSWVLLRKSELGACLDIGLMLREASWEWFSRLMKIGIPACIQDLSWVGGNFVLFFIFSHTADPTTCQAAWAVGLRLEEMLGGFPIYALNGAIATIVGQNLGAGQPERAERAGWQVAFAGAAFNTLVALVLFFGAHFLARLMSSDAKVISASVQYLQILAVAQPFVAVWLILMGAMNGAGYTNKPMWVTVLCMTGIRLPLAWYLSITLSLGAVGTWYAVAISCVAVGLLMIWHFRAGQWKLQAV